MHLLPLALILLLSPLHVSVLIYLLVIVVLALVVGVLIYILGVYEELTKKWVHILFVIMDVSGVIVITATIAAFIQLIVLV